METETKLQNLLCTGPEIAPHHSGRDRQTDRQRRLWPTPGMKTIWDGMFNGVKRGMYVL